MYGSKSSYDNFDWLDNVEGEEMESDIGYSVTPHPPNLVLVAKQLMFW